MILHKETTPCGGFFNFEIENEMNKKKDNQKRTRNENNPTFSTYLWWRRRESNPQQPNITNCIVIIFYHLKPY